MMEHRTNNIFDDFGIRCQSQEKGLKRLYKRQKAEAALLISRFNSSDHGSGDIQLLADDVGLGKTWVSMIVLFSLLNTEKACPHSLVITPSRLLADKWYRELSVFQRGYIKNSRDFGIELITSSSQLFERLRILKSQNSRDQKLKNMFSRKGSGLFFMAFCLSEYLQTYEFYGNSNSVAVKNIERWIKNVLKRDEVRLFHRFFSQSEIVQWVRFLRKYAPVVGYDNWLDHKASPEKIKLALDRKRLGKQSSFINSIVKSLALESSKKNEHSITKERIPVGQKFLRLAAETMPFLEVYDPKKQSNKKATDKDASNLKKAKLLENIAKNGDRAWKYLCWIFTEAKPDLENYLGKTKNKNQRLTENTSAVELLDKFTEFAQCIRFDKKDRELFEDLNPLEILNLLRKFDQNIKTCDGSDELKLMSFFDQSPWVQIGWIYSKGKSWGEFICDIANEFKFDKRTKNPSQYQVNVAKKLFGCVGSLYRFLQDRPIKGQEYFWDRRKIIHTIFVVYMNDLKKWNDFSNKKNEELRKLRKCIELTIVDEAHNWINNKKGAEDYKNKWSDCVCKTLLLTATPLQLSSKNLQQIFDSVKDPSLWSKDSAYGLLFGNESLLVKASEIQKRVQTAWENLDSTDVALLEKRSAELEKEVGRRLKQKQLKIWKEMLKSGSGQIRELSRAVLDFCEFLEQDIRTNLSKLVMKNRSNKNRKYICGKDVLVKGNLWKGRMYPVSGLPNSATLFNFICMRLSSIGNRRDKNGQLVIKNPKLMLGLPSSYEAMFESQVGKKLNSASESFYKEIYNHLIKRQYDLKHPKVELVSEIVFENLIEKGEKTLVFCERLETVKVLKKQTESKVNAFYKKIVDTEQLTKIYQTAKKAINKQQDEEHEEYLKKY